MMAKEFVRPSDAEDNFIIKSFEGGGEEVMSRSQQTWVRSQPCQLKQR